MMSDQRDPEKDGGLGISPAPPKQAPVDVKTQPQSTDESVNQETEDIRKQRIISRQDFHTLVGVSRIAYNCYDANIAAHSAHASQYPDNVHDNSSSNGYGLPPQNSNLGGQATPARPLGIPGEPGLISRTFNRKNTARYNEGLYRRVVLEEEQSRWRYHSCNLVVNMSLIIQLALSAVIIALGAADAGFRVAVTTVGAVNGVLAGILSLVKGQGLPGRYLHYRLAMSRIRDEIERLDRRMFEGGPPVTYADVHNVYEMYRVAREQFEKNHPEVWNVDSTKIRQMADDPKFNAFGGRGLV